MKAIVKTFVTDALILVGMLGIFGLTIDPVQPFWYYLICFIVIAVSFWGAHKINPEWGFEYDRNGEVIE